MTARQPAKPMRQPSSEPLRQTLREAALSAAEIFHGDANLVHGPISFKLSNEAVPTSGYSINLLRVPDGQNGFRDIDEEALKAVKLVLVACMDQRQIADLVDKVKKQHSDFKDEEILVISMGGGIVQTDSEKGQRDTALRAMLSYIVDVAEQPIHIVATAHTSDITSPTSGPCGGITYMADGKIAERVTNPQTRARIAEEYLLRDESTQSYELAETAEVAVASTYAIISDLQTQYADKAPTAEVLVVVPNDQTKTVRQVHTQPVESGKLTLSQILV